MKKLLVLLLASAALLAGCEKDDGKSDESTEYFYWYNDEKVILYLSMDYVNLIIVDALRDAPASDLVFEDGDVDWDNSFQSDGILKLDMESVLAILQAYEAAIDRIQNDERVTSVLPFFITEQGGALVGLSNFFMVQLKDSGDIDILQKQAAKEGVIIDHQNEYMPLWYVLKVTETSKHNALELANRFYESGLFEHAEPDLVSYKPRSFTN